MSDVDWERLARRIDGEIADVPIRLGPNTRDQIAEGRERIQLSGSERWEIAERVVLMLRAEGLPRLPRVGQPEVRPGQVWADRSRHEEGRTVRVEAVGEGNGFVDCVVLTPKNTNPGGRTGHRTRIRVDSFPTRYRWVEG